LAWGSLGKPELWPGRVSVSCCMGPRLWRAWHGPFLGFVRPVVAGRTPAAGIGRRSRAVRMGWEATAGYSMRA
jgi:hypothetical protein